MKEISVAVFDNGRRVVLLDAKVALAEKGVEYKEEDLTNKSPLLLQMNPFHKTIGVLIHNDETINESLIIAEYIDEAWKGQAPLLLSDRDQRAQAKFWADFVGSKVHGVGKRIWAANVEEHEQAKKELILNLKQLEEALGDKPNFGGDTFGLVDVALIPFYKWFYVYETIGYLKVEAECPKIVEWAKRCLQRGSVQKSLADKKEIYEVVLGHRKKLQLD
ncbi:probable glutathione S-transferase parC [Neltuma alba]|uniref:probable glutathione S-transferase parC n=1 Tax=Neltuma alba TaxID=207710 RepID=UPI0010A33DB7|nr:probable glutathione S-transferase parC [Prosopis alba]